MLETQALPDVISFFPGLTDRVYFQNPETKEFWFHGSSVCKTLGFSNVTSALALHCDDDEKLQEIWNGKATWFVSEAGCYGLAMGAKNDVAKDFKRWLKHEVLPKLRASGAYILPTATSEQLGALIKNANLQLLAKYKSRSVTYKTDKEGYTKMTVYKNRVKEYETYISDKSKPSLVNPQILIIGHYDDDVDCCNIDIDSPMKEAYVRWRDYDHVCDRRWKRDELEEWVRVNFPVAA